MFFFLIQQQMFSIHAIKTDVTALKLYAESITNHIAPTTPKKSRSKYS